MKYPRIEIDLNKISENTKTALTKTKKQNIEIACVSKVIGGNLTIMQRVIESGIKEIADSRIDNFIEYKDLNAKKLLIRIPMESELNDVVKYCDRTLISEMETAKLLSKEAVLQNKEFEVVLMTDLGDLREGCFYEEELYKTALEIFKLPNIKMVGIGTNWACYGGVMPTDKNLAELCKRKEHIEDMLKIKLGVVSAGSSNCFHLLDTLPECISHLRVGSAIFVGTGLNDELLAGYHHDVFRLKAQIVELKKKPSVPIGEKCLNAFGKIVEFEDRGEITRAIIAIGRQDVDIEELICTDSNVIVLGSSSDHIVLEVPSSYKLGDIVTFNLTYPGVLKVMTSKYVNKYYLN